MYALRSTGTQCAVAASEFFRLRLGCVDRDILSAFREMTMKTGEN